MQPQSVGQGHRGYPVSQRNSCLYFYLLNLAKWQGKCRSRQRLLLNSGVLEAGVRGLHIDLVDFAGRPAGAEAVS